MKSDNRYAPLLVAGILLAFAALFFVGCTNTVTPKPIPAQTASYDGAEQNSGLLALVPGGALITESTRVRYNALVEIYGGEFVPVLTRNKGIRRATAEQLQAAQLNDRKNLHFIDNEALQNFVLMSTWRRMGQAIAK